MKSNCPTLYSVLIRDKKRHYSLKIARQPLPNLSINCTLTDSFVDAVYVYIYIYIYIFYR
jgi:hypothetical protein